MTDNRGVIVSNNKGKWNVFRLIDDKKYKIPLNFNSKIDALNYAMLLSRREGYAKVMCE